MFTKEQREALLPNGRDIADRLVCLHGFTGGEYNEKNGICILHHRAKGTLWATLLFKTDQILLQVETPAGMVVTKTEAEMIALTEREVRHG